MCTFSMTIKTFLLCLCLTACNGNEEVTEAETSSGYPLLLNKTVPVQPNIWRKPLPKEAWCKLIMTPATMWMGTVKCAQIQPMSTCRMGIRNHPMNAMMCSISYMGMEKQLPPSFRTRTA